MSKDKGSKKAGKKSKRQKEKERPEKKGLNMGFIFLVLIVLAGTGVFMLVQHQFAVRAEIKTRSVEVRITEEKSKQESLRLSLAALKSPGRVARVATDELGLADPTGVIYLKYSRDASGTIITQSTYEEIAAPEQSASAENSTEPAAAENSIVEETGAATSGTGR